MLAAPVTHSCTLTHEFRALTTKLLCRKWFGELKALLKTILVLGFEENESGSHCDTE